MSATSDVTNGLVLTGEDFGYNYGIQSLPALAPPGTRKMRIAMRAWVDIDPLYSRHYVAEDYHSTTCYGLSWLPQVPYQANEEICSSSSDSLRYATDNPETFAGFTGAFSCLTYSSPYFSRNYTCFEPAAPMQESLTTVGGDWAKDINDEVMCLYGYYNFSPALYQNGYFLNGKSLTDGIANRPQDHGVNGFYTYSFSYGDEHDMLCTLPRTAAYGNQVTIGWEFSANELDQRITFRYFQNAESLAENNLISCFDESPRLQESNFLPNSATQWRPDLTTYNWPGYFVMRNGHPTMVMTLKAYTVAYYDINGDPLL